MKIYKTAIIACAFIIMPAMCFAAYFSSDASYDVCFTPNNDCAKKIIKTISQAKKQVLVQAYTFTDISIAKALAKAKQDGVDVRIILDKSQIEERFTLMKFFNDNKIKVLVESPPNGLAHNKVMIIDNLTVIGGSYNYSKAASKRNIENVIIIKDAGLAKKYAENWHMREKHEQ